MRKLFCLFSLFAISLSASAASEWLFYKNYPWVYDHVSKDWLYLRGSSDGEIYAYRNSTKAWEKLVVPDVEWEENFKLWSQNPELYGGQEVLDIYKKAKYERLAQLDFTFSGKYVGNIDPISGVKSLEKLNLFAQGISDVTALAELINLQELDLGDNFILDIRPLRNLKSLRYLSLQENGPIEMVENEWRATDKLSDISALSNLSNLESLYLMYNDISDLTPLAGLDNLEVLWLYDNSISDLSPLAGLANLKEVRLWGNPITASQKTVLEEALPNTSIIWPDVIIDDSQETEKTWEQKYEEWILDPEPYGGLGVLEKIKEAKDAGAEELYFPIFYNNISDLTPLASLTNLKRLEFDLYDNNISDLTPLASLTNLTRLALSGNRISDISPLSSLTNLTTLDLDRNNITDLSPLEGLIKLEYIFFHDNNISDVTPLAGLSNLELLDLSKNKITDPSPLAVLTNLTDLDLTVNKISDLSPLAGLTNLTKLDIAANKISDLTPLAGLFNLEFLNLLDNNISELSPLAGLTNLEILNLSYKNPITASQKAMLEQALPNTYIYWPEIINEKSSTSPKTAKLEIFTDSLDWEAIFKSRDDYVYTNYNVLDDGFSSGNFKVSISAYDANYPNIQATSTTNVDISNFRSDDNGDGIYDILDPVISYQGSFTGTETANYYNNNSYLGNVVFETLFDATRSSGQTFVQATIFATVTSSSISAIQVGQTFSVNRDYYTLGWSGTLDYDSTSYKANFSDNQTKVGYSANSQITQTNESSITLKNFSLPNSLGTTTNTDISLTREGDIFHKQFVSNGITYYFRVLDIKDSNISGNY